MLLWVQAHHKTVPWTPKLCTCDDTQSSKPPHASSNKLWPDIPAVLRTKDCDSALSSLESWIHFCWSSVFLFHTSGYKSTHLSNSFSICISSVFLLNVALLPPHNSGPLHLLCLHVGKMASHHPAASHYITQRCSRRQAIWRPQPNSDFISKTAVLQLHRFYPLIF